MYVGLKMLKNFVTVTPQTLVRDAEKLFEESKLWKLLVVDNDEVVGYVRKSDVMRALPSLATSLDKHELNYLMSKLTIEKIMRTDFECIEPEAEIEVAASRMLDSDLAGLAVMDGNGKLIGYINRTVMLGVLVEEMGLGKGGSRITFEVEDRSGVLCEVSSIINDMNIGIISTGTFFHDSKRIVVIRIGADDPTAVVEAIAAKGYKIVGPVDFASEWK